jgi:hypothetical protein
MQNDLSNQFNHLREEFRLLQSGFKPKNIMAEPSPNNSWLIGVLLDGSEKGPDVAPSIASSLCHLSPFKSSESSHWTVEREKEESEAPTTLISVSDDEETPLHPGHRYNAENSKNLLDGAIGHQRSRKGHRKSREGCFNCKRRKIKVCICPKWTPMLMLFQCQETQPACENCTKKKIECSYPAPKSLKALQGSLLYSPSPIASVTLHSTPIIFSLTDMRLFHHFLTDAYPHLPVGSDSAWLSQVPLIAHHVSSLSFLISSD